MHSIRAGKLSKLSKAAEQQVSPPVHTPTRPKLCCAAVCWYVRYGGKGILEYSSKA
jgi:hypothetical protein